MSIQHSVVHTACSLEMQIIISMENAAQIILVEMEDVPNATHYFLELLALVQITNALLMNIMGNQTYIMVIMTISTLDFIQQLMQEILIIFIR